ncbi:MAG: InlB B-repeat-containing protein, partial [Spirochaetales bacterium]|nr:InlB B-repeat-containing protein [Spirochaetales bacterium]
GEHTIKYHTDQGDASVNKASFKETDTIVLKDLSADGYTFGGWFDNAQYSGTAISKLAKGTKTGNVEFWAKWIAHTYKIVFNANGGTGTMPNQDMTYDVKVNLAKNQFTKTGYSFDGWATTADGQLFLSDEASGVSNLTAVNNATVDLYAKWTPNTNTPYTVEYWLQDVSGDGYTRNDDTVHKTGMTDTSTDAVANTYDHFTVESFSQKTIAGDGNTVIKIYYKRDIISFTFKTNGGKWSDGTTADKVISGRYQAEVNKPADPTREGCTFSGWDETVPNTFDAVKTFTAVWTNVFFWVSNTSTIAVTKAESDGTITLTAADGYTDYRWYMDDEEISASANSKTLTLTTASLLSGVVYQIVLEAKKNGVIYGAQITVKK